MYSRHAIHGQERSLSFKGNSNQVTGLGYFIGLFFFSIFIFMKLSVTPGSYPCTQVTQNQKER